MNQPLSLPPLPGTGKWAVAPVSFDVTDGALTIVAGPRSDIFNDPASDAVVANSPRLLFPVEGDFSLAALVEVDFRSTFDAGVLLLWVDANHHAKLCFEYSPQGRPMIVSVVTNGRSDDCNSVEIEGNRIWLRVSRTGGTPALHWSRDGLYWVLVRTFVLQRMDGLQVGFSSQSPTGEGCRSCFSGLSWRTVGVREIRSGE